MGDRQVRDVLCVFCGNFEYDANEREIERMFARYGRVERVDMKTGFAFVYMTDKRDAEDAIRALDRREFGYKRRRLRVEWAKVGDRSMRLPPAPGAREDARRRDSIPTATLFVVNFDIIRTRQRDLERHFEPYGRLKRVDIKRNYAFVEYESVDSAVDAQKSLDGSNLLSRNITVEFVTNEDPHSRRNTDTVGYARGRRSRSRSPRYRSHSPGYAGRRGSPARSASPRRHRDSPGYRRSRSPIRDPSPQREASRSRSPSRGRSYSRSPRSRSPR